MVDTWACSMAMLNVQEKSILQPVLHTIQAIAHIYEHKLNKKMNNLNTLRLTE